MSAGQRPGFHPPDGLEPLLPRYQDEMSRDLSQLNAVLHAPELAAHAHAMAGKSSMFGDEPLAALLSAMEQAALRGDRSALPSLLTQIEASIAQLQTLVL